jgi:S1-C subfamily serine protease
MKMLLLAFGLSGGPTLAATPQPEQADARLVPTIENGGYTGLKVCAIQPGGRFQSAHFQNGDIIEQVDGQPITTDAGSRALYDRVIEGSADATVVVRRKGARITLTSRAKR